MILPCDCKHKFQDKRYGKGKRVHTPGRGNTKDQVIPHCTVCGKSKGSKALRW